MDVTLSPVGRLQGRLAVPGDKSVSHRALILAAMATGRSVIRGAAPGADVASTAASLARLGADLPAAAVSGLPRLLSVDGSGWQVAQEAHLDTGNSGTTMRLLTGALAGRPGRFVLSGDASLSTRPMERVASPLRRMGASVSLAAGGRPPIQVERMENPARRVHDARRAGASTHRRGCAPHPGSAHGPRRTRMRTHQGSSARLAGRAYDTERVLTRT